MKVAVIGSGGREHALCAFLKKSKKITDLYCLPGNAGTSLIAKNISLNISFNVLHQHTLGWEKAEAVQASQKRELTKDKRD